MCGICGIAYADGERPVRRSVLEGMSGSIVHRGPDEDGYLFRPGVGLASRRLSIIDLEGGRQPISNEDGSAWVVLNGEIYNYPELRRELEGHGHRFRTRTDTETVVHAYETFGDAFVEQLHGMFAVALWDERRRRLVLARDRVGIKPLYYTRVDGAVVFGSELRCILAYPGVERRIDPDALSEYLSFEFVPSPRTIFEGIHKLPPGHILVFEGGELRVRPYWDFRLSASERRPPLPKSRGSYAAELLEVLRESVRSEMVSDVPVGVLLSGGIDSSLVAALMAEASPGQVQSFSIGFEDPSFDESGYARQVARHLGTRHHELTLTADRMLDLVPQIAGVIDEPLGDSSLIPTTLLSRFVREHVKVALGGDGGDELFAGYPTLQAHRLMGLYERFVPAPIRSHVVPRVVGALPVSFDNISFDFKARRFVDGQGRHPLVRHQRWMGSFTPEQKEELLQPGARSGGSPYQIAFEHLRNCDAETVFNQVLYCDMKLYLEGDILPKVDRASMSASLEVRVPLLNNAVLRYAEQLPFDVKLRGLTTKYLLRRVAQDYLPPEILRRKKKGFNMPVARWLTGPLRPLAEEMFAPERLGPQGLFDPAYVSRLYGEHLAGRRDHRKLLWTLLVFQLWFDRWMTNPAVQVRSALAPAVAD